MLLRVLTISPFHPLDEEHLREQTFEFEGMPGHVSVETVTLEEQDGKTKLTVRRLYQSVEDRDGHYNSGMEAGLKESHDRLAELLGSMK